VDARSRAALGLHVCQSHQIKAVQAAKLANGAKQLRQAHLIALLLKKIYM
jgi:hypothetical protein